MGLCAGEKGRGEACGATARAGHKQWAEAGKRERGERRGGWADQQAKPVAGVGLNMKEGRFFKMNFFSNSNFQI